MSFIFSSNPVYFFACSSKSRRCRVSYEQMKGTHTNTCFHFNRVVSFIVVTAKETEGKLRGVTPFDPQLKVDRGSHFTNGCCVGKY